MIPAAGLVDALCRGGIRVVSGVPCSWFPGVIAEIEARPEMTYVAAANEGAAVAVAVGAALAGRPAAVLAQNSGFGNMVNPLASLALPYAVPVLGLVSMRGWPVASAGEPQHAVMGRVTEPWLGSLGVPTAYLTADAVDADALLGKACDDVLGGRSSFVLVAKNAVTGAETRPRPTQGVCRDDVVDALAEVVTDEFVVSTTGYLSRALFNRWHRERNLYLQGSMGHAAAVALGAAVARPDERFVVLDGDGAALMHLGTMATVGHYAPPNLRHVVFDNGAYESTGAQPVAARADFARVAAACGYGRTEVASDRAGTTAGLAALLSTSAAGLLWVKGRVGGDPGERASSSLPVEAVAAAFAGALTAKAAHP